MIGNKRLTDFLDSLEPSNGSLLEEIEEIAKSTLVPIIKPETAALLKTMVAAKNPDSILEVGTAVGYSAILMSGVMSASCHLTTIENYEKRIPLAKENFRRAEVGDRITLIEGDAGEVLNVLQGPFDFIFMDAAKGQYVQWLPQLLRLLSVGGVLISDNVLQNGDIVESRFAVERRNRTIHSRMREYLFALKHTDRLTTSILPVGDGVTVSVRLY